MKESRFTSHLARLEAADLIRPGLAEPEPEYWFRQGLIQETVYESLLRSQRSVLHRRVAQAIEQLAADRAESLTAWAAVLALHYDRAGEASKAFRYAAMAGDAARRRYAHQEALRYYDRALALAERLGDPALLNQVRAVFVGRGEVQQVSGDHPAAAETYRQMLAFAERAGDAAMQADALNRLSTIEILAGGAPDLADHRERALALARQVGDPILIGKAQWSFGLDQRFKDPQRAVESFQEALRLVQDMDSPEARELAAVVFLDLSVTRLVMGRLRQAQATMDEATARLRALDNRPLLADTLGGGAWIRQMRGEAAEARARTAEGLRISHEIGNPWGVVYNESVLQMIETDAGHLEQVLSAAADLLARAHTVGFPGFVGMNLMITSRAWLEAGQVERGLAVAQAYETAHQGTEALWRTINAGTLGRALMAKGDLDGAGAVLEPLWREGEDASDRMEGLTFAGPAIADWALESGRLDHGLRFCNWLVGFFEAEEGKRVAGELRYYRGRIHRALGDLEAAEADLSRARELLVRAEADILVWRVDAGLADLFQARGQAGQAAEHRRQAVERVQQLASGIADPQLRASFLARPDVQKLLG